jgi:hypothetical protein
MPTATTTRNSKNPGTKNASAQPARKAGPAARGSLGSPALGAAIRAFIAGGRVGRRPTLTDIHKALQKGVSWSEGEIQFPQDRTALVIELDELIDRFGPRARAEDFAAPGR